MDIETIDRVQEMLDDIARMDGYEDMKDYIQQKYPDEEFAI